MISINIVYNMPRRCEIPRKKFIDAISFIKERIESAIGEKKLGELVKSIEKLPEYESILITGPKMNSFYAHYPDAIRPYIQGLVMLINPTSMPAGPLRNFTRFAEIFGVEHDTEGLGYLDPDDPTIAVEIAEIVHEVLGAGTDHSGA